MTTKQSEQSAADEAFATFYDGVRAAKIPHSSKQLRSAFNAAWAARGAADAAAVEHITCPSTMTLNEQGQIVVDAIRRIRALDVETR